MNKNKMDVIFEAQTALLEMSSFCKRNTNVQTPRTEEEYQNIASELMDIIRETYKQQ